MPPSSIVDVDLVLADTQPCAVGGAHGELLLAPRLDNLHSCYTALAALIDGDATLAADVDVRVVALFDHEEVGSTSAVGANSALLPSALDRIHRSLPGGGLPADAAAAAMARSLLVSADMAHAVHPNYMGKHEERHRPALGGGMVIKTNANQRYATSGATGALLRAAVAAAAAHNATAGGVHPLAPLQAYVALAIATSEATVMLGPALRRAAGARAIPGVGGNVTTPRTPIPPCLWETLLLFPAELHRWYVTSHRPPAARAAAAAIAGRVRRAMGDLIRGAGWFPAGPRGGEEAAMAALRVVDGSEADPVGEHAAAAVAVSAAPDAYAANRVAAFGAAWRARLVAATSPCVATDRPGPLLARTSILNPLGAYDAELHTVTVPAMLFAWPLLYVPGGGSDGGGAGGNATADVAMMAAADDGGDGAGADPEEAGSNRTAADAVRMVAAGAGGNDGSGVGAPAAYSYGRLGFVYGSAYSSSLGPRSLSVARGAKRWWTAAASAAFVARAACVAAYYDTLPIRGVPGAFVDGLAARVQAARDETAALAALAALRAERAAGGGGDNASCTSGAGDSGGGVGDGGGGGACAAGWAGSVAATNAGLAARYTDEQLYWIGVAQQLCTYEPPAVTTLLLRSAVAPAAARVAGLVGLSPDFAAAWQCPAAGRAVNGTEAECSIW